MDTWLHACNTDAVSLLHHTTLCSVLDTNRVPVSVELRSWERASRRCHVNNFMWRVGGGCLTHGSVEWRKSCISCAPFAHAHAHYDARAHNTCDKEKCKERNCEDVGLHRFLAVCWWRRVGDILVRDEGCRNGWWGARRKLRLRE